MNERPTPETAMMLDELIAAITNTDNAKDGLKAVVKMTTAKCKRLESERDEERDALRKARIEAETLATSIHKAEYAHKAPEWSLCDTVAGVITQIDNIYTGVRMQRDDAMAENAANIEQLSAITALFGNDDTIGGESALDYVRRKVDELRDALRVRMAETYCDECNASMITEEHAETCRHYATEREVMQ